jgi:predicted permease
MVSSLQDDITQGVRPALVAIVGAVALVLMIACVNVTNLLLARGAQRRGEFAMRAALGAGRLRLIRQVLAESFLLAIIGGAVGLFVSEFGVRALVALSPPGLPRAHAIRVDASVFLFALAITTLIGVVVGFMPALDASGADLHAELQQSSRHTTGGRQTTRHALVVAEIALALVLLVGAGLLLRSLQRLFTVAPGFERSHLLTMQVQTSGHRFKDDATTHRFFAQAADAVRQVPGVMSAAFTSQLPLTGSSDVYGVHFESSPTGNPEADNGAFRYAVTPDYFETMGIRLLRGRLLDAHDTAGATKVVVISDSLAKSKFPGADPIAQRVRVGPPDGPWSVIVGVVGNVKQMSLAMNGSDAVYMPTTHWRFTDRALWLVVRVHGDAAAFASAVQNAVWSVDKDQPIVRVATMDDRLAASAAERRFALVLFETFALVALVLAAIGIYGILSGSVAERRREIGLRSALGASPRDILALVVRDGAALTGLGLVIGVAGAAFASRAIATLLFGISPLDATTYLGVVMLLVGVAAVACWAPAWRAVRVDPSITLRAE